MKHLMTILCLVVALFQTSDAQQKPFELGLFGGLALYSGDLSPASFGIYLHGAEPAYGLLARANLRSWLALRLAYSAGSIAAEDAQEQRGLAFRSRLEEITLVVEIQPWRFALGDRALIPYLCAGIGYFQFNPEARDGNEWIALQPLGTEGQLLPDGQGPYSLREVNFPLGIGLKFILSDRLALGLELGGRKLLTDYLDDVGNALVDYRVLFEQNGPVSARMSNPKATGPEDPALEPYRRGGAFNDWYYLAGLSIAYRLGGRSSQPAYSGKPTGCYRF